MSTSKLGTNIHEAALKVREVAYRTDAAYIVVLIDPNGSSHMATDLTMDAVLQVFLHLLEKEPKVSERIKVGES